MSCPKCSEGLILPGDPTGSIQPDFMGAYFAPGPGGADKPSNRVVLVLTDVFGLEIKNCKIIADGIAKRLQCDVWIPDYFEG